MVAEVFCSIRNISLKWYGLDPVHCISVSELTFDAGLKLCKIELKLLGNIKDYIWFESQMRGGICLVGKRFAKANKPLSPNTYDSSKPISYIPSLDDVNLYGYATKRFPYRKFYWLTADEVQRFNLNNIFPDSDADYVLEGDLEISSSQHERQNDWPMAPEHLKSLMKCFLILCTKFNLTNTLTSKKLTLNFFSPKKNYITYYLNLKFYLEHGLILNKIHRILAFALTPQLREYIDFNDSKRIPCKTESEN
ncbi:uncharacterized protein CDAR_265131 [Caerostris darwini]|uniref:LAGLIDADG homing endonuclease n=1 Tax=Caerostris darwini TaxID=1538125 RepID=A0AAV4W2H5_9ARAC|nr:uncharacterized protein CDAR_265131 [Caerostris darwini]